VIHRAQGNPPWWFPMLKKLQVIKLRAGSHLGLKL
jgi:hypothetical protein